MTPIQRWLRFNLVGLLGMAVQLLVLALLNRLLHGHYLLATVLALETTLLHNYAWHRRYTWRDRPRTRHALLRFHASNGAISLAGNLLLMRVLVHEAHLRPLVANLVVIPCCAAANFAIAHRWTFADSREGQRTA